MSVIKAWSWSQFKEWTESVDKKLNLLVADTKKKPISDELERQINRAWMMSKKIDLKVPDTKSECDKTT